MRLSLPQRRRMPEHVVIESAEAIAYRVPMDLTAEDVHRTVAPFNYLISITGRTPSGDSLSGLGEAQPRPRQTGDLHDQSWPFLDSVLRDLIGRRIRLTGGIDPIADMAAQWAVAAGAEEETGELQFRGTLSGLEAALLDLVAKVRGVTLADLLGRRRIFSTGMPRVMRRREPEQIAEYFRSLPAGDIAPLRLVGGDDVDSDLEHLERVARIRRQVKPRSAAQPLWLNLRSRIDLEEAQRVVAAAVDGAAQGVLPRTVVLQHLLPRDQQHKSGELQELADLLSEGHQRRPDVRILAGSAGPEATQQLVDSGQLRMLSLRPAQLGGVLTARRMAEDFADNQPEAQILLAQFPGASRVTQMVQRDLAKALPALQYVGATADVERRFGVSRRVSHTHRTPLLRRGTGLRLHYQALVTRARARILHPAPQAPTESGLQANVYDDVDYIAPIGAYAVHGHIVEREALARGLNSWRFTKSSIVVSDSEGVQLPFRTTRWPLSGVVASSVARHKEATRILLKRAGCPVPEGRTFHGGDHEVALKYAHRIGYPVVLKPAEGSMGVGVTANIRSDGELETALQMFSKTAHGNNEFIVEKHVNGGDYRIMVIGDHVAAAVQRIPANVTGDGVQTIGQLMIAKNLERRRNSHLGPLKIKWNPSVEYQLKKQGYGIDSVPPDGERIYLLSTNNLTQGGDSIEILDELHPSIKEACVRAVQAVPGMGYCGVDFLLEDHTRPLDEQDAAICELNAMAALPVAEYPVYGTPRRLSEEFIARCVEAFGLNASADRAEALNLRLTIRGGVSGVGYRRWFARRAERSGLIGWIRATGEREAEARICGATAAAAAMVTVAILGPPKAAPESVFAVHVEDELQQLGFHVLDEATDEVASVAVEPGHGADAEDFEEAGPREAEPDPEFAAERVEADTSGEAFSPEELEEKLEETQYDDDVRL